MDDLFVYAKDAKERCKFDGSTDEFKHSSAFVDWCIENKKFIRVAPQDLSRECKDRYTDFLVQMLKTYLKSNPKIRTWSEFAALPENNKAQAMFHQFGVRGEVFGIESFQEDDLPKTRRSQKNLTLEEFYEMCQIQFHYEGSLASFKRFVARRYGSFAEYCIPRNLDINGTTWENHETALRVARKIGSIEDIKSRAASLYKYLVENELLDEVFRKSAS